MKTKFISWFDILPVMTSCHVIDDVTLSQLWACSGPVVFSVLLQLSSSNLHIYFPSWFSTILFQSSECARSLSVAEWHTFDALLCRHFEATQTGFCSYSCFGSPWAAFKKLIVSLSFSLLSLLNHLCCNFHCSSAGKFHCCGVTYYHKQYTVALPGRDQELTLTVPAIGKKKKNTDSRCRDDTWEMRKDSLSVTVPNKSLLSLLVLSWVSTFITLAEARLWALHFLPLL